MTWHLSITTSAVRDLKNLPPASALDVVAALESYAATGQGDVKKLTATNPPQWRLRRGDWRAVLIKDKTTRMLIVLRVRHRREVYVRS